MTSKRRAVIAAGIWVAALIHVGSVVRTAGALQSEVSETAAFVGAAIATAVAGVAWVTKD